MSAQENRQDVLKYCFSEVIVSWLQESFVLNQAWIVHDIASMLLNQRTMEEYIF